MSDTSITDEHIQKEEKKYLTFYNLALVLCFVTLAEVIAIFLPFVKGLIFWILVVLSLGKFFAVIFIFMHLVYDKMIYTLLFLAGLLLASGTVMALMALFSPSRIDEEAITSFQMDRVEMSDQAIS